MDFKLIKIKLVYQLPFKLFQSRKKLWKSWLESKETLEKYTKLEK